MMIHECSQGTPEWYQARCGVITASMFAECRKRLKSGPNKGDYSKAAKEYAFKVAVERLSGKLLEDEQFETWQARRGRELEPTARVLHEERKEILVQQAGFATTDDGVFGASVDGLIDNDGISEYKCFISPSSIMPIILEGNIEDCKDQVQGGLWVSERNYAHFCLYCPALESVGKELTIFEVERDDNYIQKLESDLLEFNRLVESYMEFLQQKPAIGQ